MSNDDARSSGGVDLEALLVALVLDPATFSRNRFFAMYRSVEVQRVRRRAALIRTLARHLGSELEVTYDASGWAEIAYRVPALALRRRTRLAPLELSLVRHTAARLGRSLCGEAHDSAADRARIEKALRRLAPRRASWRSPSLDGSSRRPAAADQPIDASDDRPVEGA